jgi:hypothetical protein
LSNRKLLSFFAPILALLFLDILAPKACKRLKSSTLLQETPERAFPVLSPQHRFSVG